MFKLKTLVEEHQNCCRVFLVLLHPTKALYEIYTKNHKDVWSEEE